MPVRIKVTIYREEVTSKYLTVELYNAYNMMRYKTDEQMIGNRTYQEFIHMVKGFESDD